MDTLATPVRQKITTVALAYARLSKDKGKLSENVAFQLREDRAFIDDQEWQFGGEYKDNDISASKFGTKTRDDYWRMVNDIKNWPDSEGCAIQIVIVVTEMPRVYRDMQELFDLIRLAEPQPGGMPPPTKLRGIWTIDGFGYDLSTARGVFEAIGAVNRAMFESAQASERQLRRKKNQARFGKYMGGQRRYGFEGVKKDERGNIVNRSRINIIEIPEEIANWMDWFYRLVAGEPEMSLVRSNNKRGIKPPNAGQVRPDGTVVSDKWRMGNLGSLMKNEAYVIFDDPNHLEDCPCLENPEGGGTLVHKTSRTKHRARWRGLITRQQYELLLDAFEARSQHHQHGMTYGRKYLLSGINVCGGTFNDAPCGFVMYGNGRKLANGGYQRRYSCKGVNSSGERVSCGRVFRDAIALDEYVSEAVLERLDTPEVAKALATEDTADEAVEVTNQLVAMRERRDLIQKQYARGEIETLAEYKTIRSEAETAVEELQGQLRKLRSNRASNLLPADGNIRDAWAKNEDVAWRRAIIQLVIDKVIVKPGMPPGGMTYKGRRFNPASVEIVWKEAVNLSRQLPDEVLSAVVTLVKDFRQFALAA